MPRRHQTPPTAPAGDRGPGHPERRSGGADTAQASDDIDRPRHPAHDIAPPASDPEMHAGVTHSASTPQGASRVGRDALVRDAVRALRERAGMSARALAAAVGMSETGYKHYENRFRKPHLPVDVAQALANQLRGRGQPPIRAEDVLRLAGSVELPSYSPYRDDAASPNARLHGNASATPSTARDVPVVASRPTGWGTIAMNFRTPPTDLLPRPSALASNSAIWALTIADASLAPPLRPRRARLLRPVPPPSRRRLRRHHPPRRNRPGTGRPCRPDRGHQRRQRPHRHPEPTRRAHDRRRRHPDPGQDPHHRRNPGALTAQI